MRLYKIFTLKHYFSVFLWKTLYFLPQFLGFFSEPQSRAQSCAIIHKSVQVFFYLNFCFQWVTSQLVAKLSSLQVQIPVPQLDIGRRIKWNWDFSGSWLWMLFSASFLLTPSPFQYLFPQCSFVAVKIRFTTCPVRENDFSRAACRTSPGSFNCPIGVPRWLSVECPEDI